MSNASKYSSQFVLPRLIGVSYTGTNNSRETYQASIPPYSSSGHRVSQRLASERGKESVVEQRPALQLDDNGTPRHSESNFHPRNEDAETTGQDLLGSSESRVEKSFDSVQTLQKPFQRVDAAGGVSVTALRGDSLQTSNVLEYLKKRRFETPPGHSGPSEQGATTSDVIYSHYPFLSIQNIHRIPPQDVNFLELEGCLRVPIRSLLDKFVERYFLHVHPTLPLLDEGDFWDFYHGRRIADSQMSLMLFQAMLFSSCTYIPPSVMQVLGFTNIRSMRSIFFRRTKLLYDFRTESSSLVISQTTLLLSLASLSSSKIPETSWLNLAIENAKLAEAHQYATLKATSDRKTAALKRVWWCCIIRDRSIGLLLKLPIQITNEHFDFSVSPLNSRDFETEFDRSEVYSPSTKRYLADIFTCWVKLYIILTDILLLAFPPRDRRPPRTNTGRVIDLHDCKANLKHWHFITKLRLSESHEKVSLPLSPNETAEIDIDQNSIILYRDLMYMYYHMSRVTICHYEVFCLAVKKEEQWNSSLAKSLSFILESRNEIQDAISGLVNCHKNLVRLGLIQWLPASAIGCIILPLVLSILNIELSPSNDECVEESLLARKHQANVLIQAFETYWSLYDGIDWVAEIVRHVISSSTLRQSSFSANWADSFAFQPTSYLRLALALDLSLSKGRLAQDRDFPASLTRLDPTDTSVSEDPFDSSFGEKNPQEMCNTRSLLLGDPTNPDSSSYSECYPFGIDEAFIGNLEDQIFLHTANGFPDHGLFQHMGVGEESTKSSSLERCSPGSSHTSRNSSVEELPDAPVAHMVPDASAPEVCNDVDEEAREVAVATMAEVTTRQCN